MTRVVELHEALKRGDLETLGKTQPGLANARSETDPRGTYPLHVAAEFGQAAAAQILLQNGADVTLLDGENDSLALSWAAFFGRPEVAKVLLDAGSDRDQRNKDWRRCAQLLSGSSSP